MSSAIDQARLPAKAGQTTAPHSRRARDPAAQRPALLADDVRREAVRLIANDYSHVAQTYVDGATDASIAETVGVREADIALLRDENFGPLARPSLSKALMAIERELASAHYNIKAVADQLSSVRSSLEALKD